MLFGRPDLSRFEIGGLYEHDNTGEVVEFVGTAWIGELGGEDVGVFRFVDAEQGCYLIATTSGYQRGEVFTPLGDALADAVELDTSDERETPDNGSGGPP